MREERHVLEGGRVEARERLERRAQLRLPEQHLLRVRGAQVLAEDQELACAHCRLYPLVIRRVARRRVHQQPREVLHRARRGHLRGPRAGAARAKRVDTSTPSATTACIAGRRTPLLASSGTHLCARARGSEEV
jgi:hypothetical protein